MLILDLKLKLDCNLFIMYNYEDGGLGMGYPKGAEWNELIEKMLTNGADKDLINSSYRIAAGTSVLPSNLSCTPQIQFTKSFLVIMFRKYFGWLNLPTFSMFDSQMPLSVENFQNMFPHISITEFFNEAGRPSHFFSPDSDEINYLLKQSIILSIQDMDRILNDEDYLEVLENLKEQNPEFFNEEIPDYFKK